MHLSSQFVSVGVNRVVNALDWGDHGFIAYGGHWIVCVYDPEAAEVIGTLTGHRGQVNCVKWLPQSVNPADARLLVSGGADASIRLWAWHDQQHNSPPWSCLHVLQAHSTAVTSLAVQQLCAGSFLLASTSADPSLQLWHCCCNDNSRSDMPSSSGVEADGDTASWQQQQEQELQRRFGAAAWQLQPPVHVGSHIQHCVALTTLPGAPGVVIMATGGTDSAIRLFVRDACAAAAEGQAAAAPGSPGQQQQQQQHGEFRLQCQLQGHENWVRSLAFTYVAEAAGPGGSSNSCCNGVGIAQQQQQQQGRVSLLLASAGQDRYGRLWCLSNNPHHASAAASAAAATANGSASSQPDALRQSITRYAPRPHLTAGGSTFWVTQEALLIGHEDWLHSVTWRPQPAVHKAVRAAGGTPRGDLCLLTVSQDRSMMLWCFDAPSGLWLSEAAVGDAGTSCLGFYGGAFSPSGNQLVAHGFTGALHLWQQQQQQQQETGSGSSSRRGGPWLPQHALGGHCGAVLDLAWGGDGGCLQSVSADQTARLFTASAGHWFELARTQVHGHDFSSLAPIATPASSCDDGSSSSQLPCPSLLYASGSEEKVLRVFEAPQAFIDTLVAIRGSQAAAPGVATDVAATIAAAAARAAGTAAGEAGAGAGAGRDTRGRALGASVAALGLSNKAVYVGDDGTIPGGKQQQGQGSGFGAEAYNEGPDFVPCAVPAVVDGPPLEEHLSQNTLWPEVRKLYGHGNDVFCVAASPGGRLLASACRAQSAGAAGVFVWEVGSWRPVAQLAGHTLTVTQLEFSHDGRFLLSGSRDRSFSLWRVPAEYQQQQQGQAGGSADAAAAAAAAAAEAAAAAAAGGGVFELVVRHKAAHSRIIWGVSWSHDSRCFATGSRDQTVRLWALSSSGQPGAKPAVVLPQLPAGVTALALAPAHVCSAAAQGSGGEGADTGRLQVVAVGLEDGQVQVWSVLLPAAAGDVAEAAQLLWASAAWQQHAAAVRRLRWAPAAVGRLCGAGDAAGAPALLASCGEDHSVRLFDVRV